MSYTETHIGKLQKVDLAGKTIEEWAKEECIKQDIKELSSYNDTWIEELRDRDYRKYFLVDGEIWEAIEHQELEDDDIYQLTPNSDGTISFTMRFYNGGTCLSECIEEGLEQLKKK